MRRFERLTFSRIRCDAGDPFDALGLIVYACPRDRCPAEWQALSHLPTYILIANALSAWETVEAAPVAKYFEGREFY